MYLFILTKISKKRLDVWSLNEMKYVDLFDSEDKGSYLIELIIQFSNLLAFVYFPHYIE